MEMYKCCCLLQILVLVLLIHDSIENCILPSNSSNRCYIVDSWTGNWTFEGYVIGPNSSDSYYLLSSVDDNECGLIREDISGQKVWAKTYSNGQCSGLTMTNDETMLYFSSAYTGFYAISEVNCTDGSLNDYKSNYSLGKNSLNTNASITSTASEMVYNSTVILFTLTTQPTRMTSSIPSFPGNLATLSFPGNPTTPSFPDNSTTPLPPESPTTSSPPDSPSASSPQEYQETAESSEPASTSTSSDNLPNSSTETNEDDDDLSTLQIFGIVIGSIFGLGIILSIVFFIVCIVRKRNNRYAGRQEVCTETQPENHAEQENNQECQQQILDH